MIENKALKTLFGTENATTVIPGVILAVIVAIGSLLAAMFLGDFFKSWMGFDKSPVSAFLLAN